MKKNLCLIVALLCPLLLPLSAPAEEDDTPLQNEMGQLNRNVRKLSRQVADPAQKTSSLEIVGKIEKNVDAAKTMMPSQAEKLTGAEKEKYLAAFKKNLDALAKEVAGLKEAITQDDAAGAKAEMEKIGQLKSSSHKELGVKMGPPGGGHGPGKGPGMPPPPPPAASPQ